MGGWSHAVVRQFGKVCSPYLSVKPGYFREPVPPSVKAEQDIRRLVRLDVEYPELYERILIPNDWCSAVLKVLRENLELALALALETEIGGYGLDEIGSLVLDGGVYQSDGCDGTRGLFAMVLQFSEIFSQIVEVDRDAAKQEFLAWPKNDDTIFARLRIWAAGKKEVVSKRDFKQVIVDLSDIAFWKSHHQRDLLLVLAHRWNELSITACKLIERRLLAGPKRWKQEKIVEFKERKAYSILNRIHWLANNGCIFSFNLEEVTKSLCKAAPNWMPEYGTKAIEPLEKRGGWVRTETNHEALLDIPLSSILSRASDLRGSSDNFLVEHDPFAGFVVNHPRRAFSALTLAAKQDEFPEWAWRRFLNSDARKNDKARFAGLVAERLATYPDTQLSTLIHPISNWLGSASIILTGNHTTSFDKIAQKLINILRTQPYLGKSGVIRDRQEPDWVTEAINSPAGIIAEAMFNDSRINGLDVAQGFSPFWLDHIEALLGLPNDLRRYTLVILFHNLDWFYAIDPIWAEKILLPMLDSSEIYDRDAAWLGFFMGCKDSSTRTLCAVKGAHIGFCNQYAPFASFLR